MKIQEGCEDWTLKFDSIKDVEFTEDENQYMRNILHTTGDSLGIVTNISPDQGDLRNKILQTILNIFLETRAKMQFAVEYTIMNHAVHAPLEKDFAYENIFGENLRDSFRATLSDEEKTIYDEALDHKEDEDGDEEKEDLS
jgi:hypothetical protein